MKFFAVALLALVGLADAKKVLDHEKLLRKAIPVDKHGNPRQLQQNGYYGGYYSANAAYNQNSQGQNYEDANGGGNQNSYTANSYKFPIYGSHSIQFNTCVSMKMEPDGDSSVFSNYLIDYTKKGQLVSQKSYVLFNVCETGYCDSGDESSLFMAELGDYMAALVDYMPAQREAYCNRCANVQDYCYQGNNQQQQYQEEAQDGERRLAGVRCSVCEDYGCFDDGNAADDNAAIDMETASAWVQNLVGCQQSGQELNGQPLYVGFMCNADGTGADLGVFTDQYCSDYTTATTFAKVMSADGEDYSDYITASKELVTFPFTNKIECDSTQFMNGNNGGGNNNAYTANEYCQNLYFDAARSVARCKNANSKAYVNSANGYYQVNEEYADNGDADNNADADYGTPSWYEYDVSADYGGTTFGSCRALAAYKGRLSHFSTFKGTSNFNYGSSNITWNNEAGSKAGKAFGFILLVAILGAVGYYVVKSNTSLVEKTMSFFESDDSKKVPLVHTSSNLEAKEEAQKPTEEAGEIMSPPSTVAADEEKPMPVEDAVVA